MADYFRGRRGVTDSSADGQRFGRPLARLRPFAPAIGPRCASASAPRPPWARGPAEAPAREPQPSSPTSWDRAPRRDGDARVTPGATASPAVARRRQDRPLACRTRWREVRTMAIQVSYPGVYV